ncbi:hypothetical protein YE105_C0337 [Yersinia enterocolitica subsp. palearctica 105.5R(r)]|uniref:Uncharacterized protein n=1 Tax=Yersinia enterocolitica subsp. palearctica serotype O:3 (strain DSM 13030 / CIP 106945 / Y11) TaxID=930944 RepID=A0A0H3NVG6_YERE1|nr:hypothetical protein YE105_C0337 [Yersinia enterocolitica subsp. palearctica 105.5R(r)]CBY28986.1 hypothetical protein Y11_35441 [Yersinia enterocolitica subsp. palearctica Y11]CCO70901.1 hypothetical protein D322_4066 [Yersinia enterocolitica IP 10393]
MSNWSCVSISGFSGTLDAAAVLAVFIQAMTRYERVLSR